MTDQLLVLVEHPRNRAATAALDTAAKAGIDVILLSADPAKYPASLSVRRVNTNSLPALRAYLRALPRRPDAVLSFSHHFRAIAAQLARDLGLHGPDPKAVAAAVDKAVMRDRLAGTPYAVRHAVVQDEPALDRAFYDLGGDVVVKPPAETSSLAVRRVTTLADARAAFAMVHARRTNRQGQVQDGRVLVEATIDGPEFSIETMTGAGGTEVYGVTAKTPLPSNRYIEQADSFPYAANQPVVEALTTAAVTALRQLGDLTGPAHTEIRLSAVGPKIMEINPRQPGGHLPTLLELTTGRNVFLETIAAAFDIAPWPAGPRRAAAATWWQLYPDRPGRLHHVDGLELVRAHPRVLLADVRAALGSALTMPTSNLDRVGDLVVSGSGPDDSLAAARDLAGMIGLDIR